MRAELREPGRIRDVGLAAGQGLHVPGVDQHHLHTGQVLEQVVERFPVVTGGLHHHTRDLLGGQVLAQREDLIGHRRPGRHRLGRLAAASPGDPDAHLGVRLGDVQPGASGMHDFHHRLLPHSRRFCRVRRGEGRRSRKSDARARRQQSTVPVEPSTTMLTYRLTGTTGASGSTATNSIQSEPADRPVQPNATAPRNLRAPAGQPSRLGQRREDLALPVSRKRASHLRQSPEVETGFEPVYTALQAVASPLGHSTERALTGLPGEESERTTGFEPATLTLAR